MIQRVRAWVDERLCEAEQKGRLAIANDRTERRRLDCAVAEGRAVEVVPRVYANASSWNDLKKGEQARRKAHALQKMHPDWVFAGPTAALLHGLAVSNRFLDKTYVATNRAHHYSSAQLCFMSVASKDVVEHDGLHLTTVPRTTGDCLRIMDFRSGLAVCDAALRKLNVSRERLVDDVSRACRRAPGIERARSVACLSDARAESGGESITRATMLELGLLVPELQREFRSLITPGKAYRVDFAWDIGSGCILGELDGYEKYVQCEMRHDRSLARIIRDEHERQSHIEAHEGVLRVVRFGFDEVMNDGAFLQLLLGCGIPRVFAFDEHVLAAGGVLRCR